MKTPFTLEAWLKDTSQKVVDKDGRPVRIICTDADGLSPIIGLLDNKTPLPCGKDGRPPYIGGGGGTLFIVTPEQELSEFEKACMKLYNEGRDDGLSGDKLSNESVKESASELLAIARAEIFANDAVLKEFAEISKERGKAEAMKDLPRWRKWENGACGNGRGIPLAIVKRGLNGYELVDALGIQGEQYIMLSDLEKLPGFKEDGHE